MEPPSNVLQPRNTSCGHGCFNKENEAESRYIDYDKNDDDKFDDVEEHGEENDDDKFDYTDVNE